MQELSPAEQGQFAGWQGAFYNLAKILTNGGLVYLAGYLSKRYGTGEGLDGHHGDLCCADACPRTISYA